MAIPTSVIGMCTMLLLHGFFLDVVIIAILPFMSTKGGDASRKALFPWCLGGYEGFGADLVPNLAPTHRRFIAENAAYALLRGVPAIYVLYSGYMAMPALVLAVSSHMIEALTIAWEIFAYNAPTDAAPPMTMMIVFSSWVLYICTTNPDAYFRVDAASLLAMQVMVGCTYFFWMMGVIGICKKSKAGSAEEPLFTGDSSDAPAGRTSFMGKMKGKMPKIPKPSSPFRKK